MKFRLEHPLPADAATTWKIIRSDEFSAQAYGRSGIVRTLESSEVKEGKTYTVLKVEVQERLPPMAAKVLGTSQLSWTQRQISDDDNLVMQWQIHIPGADKIKAQGTFRVVSDGDRCIRIVEGEVKVKIRVVGRKAEEHICSKLTRSYEKSAQFTLEWLNDLGYQ